MKKITLFIVLFLTLSAFSQEDAWVYFSDKPNAQYYLDNPLEMLTQRALTRRLNQNISLNINDTPIHQPYIDQVAAVSGIQIKAKSKWLNCLHIRGSQATIQSLLTLPFVTSVKFANNALNGRLSQTSISSAINKTENTQITYSYGNSANQVQMLNGHLLHQSNYIGTGKVIAVLDSGFINANTIQPLQNIFNNNLVLGGYNFVSGSTDVYALDSHGTLVLSCMAGKVDGQLIGTAPNAQYYLYITEDVVDENPVEESYWVAAAEEADRVGADIITTSLGYFGYDNVNYSYTYSDMTGNKAFASRGANIAFSKGIIVVASAGNSGGSPTAPHIRVPAEATHVFAVGALQSNQNYAAFSSIGPTFDNRVKPDVMAQGQGVVLSNSSGQIVSANGTSFSCPLMSGMIACLWQAVPTLTNQQILDFVKQSADRYSNPDNQYGYGKPDFQTALTNALLYLKKWNSDFKVYPNPTKDAVYFSFKIIENQVSVQIYNNLGQKVFSDDNYFSDKKISLENLQNGVYFYKIESSNGSFFGKIIKN